MGNGRLGRARATLQDGCVVLQKSCRPASRVRGWSLRRPQMFGPGPEAVKSHVGRMEQY